MMTKWLTSERPKSNEERILEWRKRLNAWKINRWAELLSSKETSLPAILRRQAE